MSVFFCLFAVLVSSDLQSWSPLLEKTILALIQQTDIQLLRLRLYSGLLFPSVHPIFIWGRMSWAKGANMEAAQWQRVKYSSRTPALIQELTWWCLCESVCTKLNFCDFHCGVGLTLVLYGLVFWCVCDYRYVASSVSIFFIGFVTSRTPSARSHMMRWAYTEVTELSHRTRRTSSGRSYVMWWLNTKWTELSPKTMCAYQ